MRSSGWNGPLLESIYPPLSDTSTVVNSLYTHRLSKAAIPDMDKTHFAVSVSYAVSAAILRGQE
jgi:hypothetical protein